MDKTILFWIVFGLFGFIFALSIQMRMMVAMVLRRALWAEFSELSHEGATASILAAAKPDGQTPQDQTLEAPAKHLQETYPGALSHLKLARRVSIIAPAGLLCTALIGRFGLGVI